MLDEAYERFVTRKGGEVKQERKRAKRINPDADADLLEVITTYFSWCLDTMTIAPEAEFLQQPKYPTSTILSIISLELQ